MFGSRRRKGVRNAVDKFKAIFERYEAKNGLPESFWSDWYVLAFVSSLIRSFAFLGERISDAEWGKIIMEVQHDALIELSNGRATLAGAKNPFSVQDLANFQVMAVPNHEYTRGTKNAERFMADFYAYLRVPNATSEPIANFVGALVDQFLFSEFIKSSEHKKE